MCKLNYNPMTVNDMYFHHMTTREATEGALEVGYVKSFTTFNNNGYGLTDDPDKQAPIAIDFYNRDNEKVFVYHCLDRIGIAYDKPFKVNPIHLRNKYV